LSKLLGTPNFTPETLSRLNIQLIPNFGLRDWKELKTWMERAGKSPALERGSGGQHNSQ
jgi:hypothetical protein